MKYSPSNHCFYPASIDYPSLPEDLVEVPDADYHLAAGRMPGEDYEVVDGRVQIIPAPEPGPFVPQSVTRFQARAALYNAGHFETVEAFMARSSTPMLMRLAWLDAQSFDRGSDTVAALASVLQLSDIEVDALFTAAAEIRG